MFAQITAGDWEAVGTVAGAAVVIGGVAGAKGSKLLRRLTERRDDVGMVVTAFKGTPKNEITGEPANPPILVQLRLLTEAVNHLKEHQEEDHADLQLIKAGQK